MWCVGWVTGYGERYWGLNIERKDELHAIHIHTHTHTHTYINTYIHTYMHTYIQTQYTYIWYLDPLEVVEGVVSTPERCHGVQEVHVVVAVLVLLKLTRHNHKATLSLSDMLELILSTTHVHIGIQIDIYKHREGK